MRSRISISILMILALAAPATARTLAVPGDAATIGGALARARPGDIILVACGTYREHDLRLPAGVTLWSGTLQPDCVVVDAGRQGRVFTCQDADSTTVVVGLTLTGGRALGLGPDGTGGAVHLQDASVKFSNCVFADNEALRGGAVAALGTSRPRFENCSFERNTAANVGGALYVAGPRTELETCLLAANWGGLGGAAIAAEGGDVALTGCTVARNGAEPGGGTLLTLDATARIVRTVIAQNGASAIQGEGRATAWAATSVIQGNRGGDWQGPLGNQAGVRGNLTAAPGFCDPQAGDFRVRVNSPCLRAVTSDGQRVRIGARDAGCPGG